MSKILIVEDDSTFAQIIEGFLLKNGFEVVLASTTKQSFKFFLKEKFDLLLVDYRLPDGTGLDVLNFTRGQGLGLPTIIMTSFNDVRTAVQSIQLGASDYITKPINPDELLMVINRSLEKKENQTLIHSNFIRGKSIVANKLYEHLDLVAPTDMSVILQGESGTGKELAAQTLHLESKRSNKPFISIDCGALSKDLAASELFGHVKGAFTGALNDKKGQFELANGGTLFLDEVGNLSYDVQIKLLRALQERSIQPLGGTQKISVDVRIITATNEDLLQRIQQGEFREDLYHRLNEFKILVPALRERGSDIELFIAHFIKTSNNELGRSVTTVAPDVKELLLSYDWPGNLRELSNVIKRLVLLSRNDMATMDGLPDEMKFSILNSPKINSSDLKATNEINEKQLIIETLSKVRYNKSKAAKILNIDRKTLYNKMERYGIE